MDYQVTNDDMDIEQIPDSNILEHREEMFIMKKNIGIKYFKIFRKLYHDNIKKSNYINSKSNYIKILIKLASYTNVYDLYIINFLARNPSSILDFFIIYFNEIINSSYISFIESECYYLRTNDELIKTLATKYPQIIQNTFNIKGANLLMIFCSSLFSSNNYHMNYYHHFDNLVSYGANVFHVDHEGNTIFHIICCNFTYNQQNLVTNLLSHVIKHTNFNTHTIINKFNSSGHTALNYALSTHNHECIKILINHGANLTSYDEELLKCNSDLEMIKYIDNLMVNKLSGALVNCNL